MTQEDKELLLKDLCSRLPYGVIGKCEIDASYDTSFDTIFQTHKFDAVVYGLKEDLLFVTPMIEDMDEQNFAEEEVADGVDISDFKPYLFSLSSMTEEQKMFLKQQNWCIAISTSGTVETTVEGIDWLNKNHFDYRGLIEKGLAIDATELNIY